MVRVVALSRPFSVRAQALAQQHVVARIEFLATGLQRVARRQAVMQYQVGQQRTCRQAGVPCHAICGSAPLGLLERRIITLAQLDEALARQTRDRRLLGSILVDMGAVGETQLQEVLKAA